MVHGIQYATTLDGRNFAPRYYPKVVVVAVFVAKLLLYLHT